jgi:transposase
MPKINSILDLPGFSIKKVTKGTSLVLDVHYRRLPRCPHCDSKQVRKKDRFVRQVKHELFGHRPTLLRFTAYKLYCHQCKRYGNQRFPGIGKYQRATQRLKKQIYHQHTDGISQKSLSTNFKLGKATIERWYQQLYLLENHERDNAPCPTVLGIDEHSFNRKIGYATTFCDLRTHKVFDVVPGRSEAGLAHYLENLNGKDRVKVVCIDLSSTYRTLIKKHFPNAMIVADRFHVIRLMQHQCMTVYRDIYQHIKHNRGILALLRTNPNNMSEFKIKKRDDFLRSHPAIAAIYNFQQRIYQILMYKTVNTNQAKKLIPEFLDIIQQLKASPFKPLATLGKTLYQWREEIVRMWRFTKSNGITEGFHRKMKLIQRRAYGFRNFENYRLRVRVLCR